MNLRFPVLSFSNPSIIEVVTSMSELTTCTSKALKDGYYTNLKVVDVELNEFTVESARKIRPIDSVWNYIFFLNQKIRVELVVPNLPRKITLDDLKKLVSESFSSWHGWSSRDDFNELKRKVRDAKSVELIISYLRN